MLNILTGLPQNKEDDNIICTNFAKSVGYKIILGSSTMKMYCRELNISSQIKILSPNISPTVKYVIPGINIANEGIITLNECYKILSGKISDNTSAIEVINLIKKEDVINFIIGTADNGEQVFYKQKRLLPRTEIIKKIVELLKDKKVTTNFV